MNIYVGNLPYKAAESDLRSCFEQYGKVSSVSIIKDRATGESKGFGFVEMDSSDEAQSAISALNGYELQGRKLRINEARPKGQGSPVGGRY